MSRAWEAKPALLGFRAGWILLGAMTWAILHWSVVDLRLADRAYARGYATARDSCAHAYATHDSLYYRTDLMDTTASFRIGEIPR